ncbi:hypothetical protein THAOC_26383 [Thalassiosira oceanica]|uniref:Uncharacterized protein n=1 Tax=Thalassiosira oceanica TaxID=159749 RepID=K0RP51_THAOC|nr:hypothetical protein THAOC_26383 [Thalassiosira oceanica]|eukprot:EJK54064.1 hypothetical protein THAOC_26383 [Thalassiosira oceanica]
MSSLRSSPVMRRANSLTSHLGSLFGCSEMADYRVFLVEDACAMLSWRQGHAIYVPYTYTGITSYPSPRGQDEKAPSLTVASLVGGKQKKLEDTATYNEDRCNAAVASRSLDGAAAARRVGLTLHACLDQPYNSVISKARRDVV